MELDLDINNYDLGDLLTLFNMPLDFDEADLKNAKGMVIRIHPDKSKLHPDYFRFYSKAYKMIYSIWNFRNKGSINNGEMIKNTDYVNFDIKLDEDKKEILDQYFQKKSNKSGFNAWFNEQFEKNKIKDETEKKGYDDWLRSNDDGAQNNADLENISMTTMGHAFDKRKEKARALVVRTDVEQMYSSASFYDLSSDAPATFDSDMFSALPYQDLQKAHTETVIPVTYEDYEQKEKFNSVNDMISHRGRQDVKPLSEQQAKDYLSNRTKHDEESSVKRAYHLAKQVELAAKKQQEFWSSIQLLKDK